MDFSPMRGWEVHVGEHVVFGFIHELGELSSMPNWQFGFESAYTQFHHHVL
jgi:hypothetical protein